MKTLRIALVTLLVIGLGAPARADTLREEAAKSAQAAAAMPPAPRSNAIKWAGTALFAGGMTMALYAFINNKNGSFAEFGEANAVNKKLGAASLATAFAGGALIFLGTRRPARVAPAVAITSTDITLTKQISW
jgi:hypothetical protein